MVHKVEYTSGDGGFVALRYVEEEEAGSDLNQWFLAPFHKWDKEAPYEITHGSL